MTLAPETFEGDSSMELVNGVLIRDVMTLDDAIDFACTGLTAKTRASYTRLLHRFSEGFPRHHDVARVVENDWYVYFRQREHLDRATRAWEETVLYSTFQKLYKRRKIKQNPFEFVPRTRRPDPEALDLVRVSTEEVGLILGAAETWSEKMCVSVLAYMGPRRGALARLRLSDYRNGRLKFFEKGGKVQWKQVPDQLAELIQACIAAGEIGEPPFDFLIPPEGPLHPETVNKILQKRGDRDDRCIWRIVREVADRAGVRAHTHSLRAAFAHFSLDSGKDSKALQEAMGHKNPATTERYIQRYDREKRQETFRDLDWASVIPDNTRRAGSVQIAEETLGESRLVGAGGFEPPESDFHGALRPGRQRSLLDALKQAKPEVFH